MFAVERLGSYISRGVYTVSGPFHPFGGAVDIVVVQQQDGSFKSSPWYVRFGKFQGVLKSKEKVVNISVNGVEANFHMYLDHKGEAYFIREVDGEEGDSLSCPSSSGDETDARSHIDKPFVKSKSCDFDSNESSSINRIDGTIVSRTTSRRSRILGLVFGRRSMKVNAEGGVGSDDMARVDSLERAEIAADLLEVKWSTNLAGKGNKPPKGNPSASIKSNSTDNKQCLERTFEHDKMENHVLEQCGLNEDISFQNENEGINSNSGCHVLRGPIEEEGGGVKSCLSASKKVVETSALRECVVQVRAETTTEVSGENDECNVGNTGRHFNGEDVPGENIVDLPGDEDPIEEEVSSDRVRSFVYCQTSESSIVSMHSSSEQTHEVLYLTAGGGGQVHLHAEVLHATTELLPKDTMSEELAEDIYLKTETSDDAEVHHMCQMQEATLLEPQMDPKFGYVVEDRVQFTGIESNFCSSSEAQDTNAMNDEGISRNYEPPVASNCILKISDKTIPSESLEEECFIFSDLDEPNINVVQCMESVSLGCFEKEDPLPCLDDEGTADHIMPPGNSLRENPYNDLGKLKGTSPIIIPGNHEVVGEEDIKLAGSLPNMPTHNNGLDRYNFPGPLSRSLDSKFKSSKGILSGKYDSNCGTLDKMTENQLHEAAAAKQSSISGDSEEVLANPVVDSPKASIGPGGNWRPWHFFGKSRSRKSMQPASNDNSVSVVDKKASEGVIDSEEVINELKPKVVKKMVRETAPTSEQLATLDLKEGKNAVIFTFSTAMLGNQQVNARIFLWKWNTRIVISDVDGTITKSDVLGQFMPLVGIDWSQTGVVPLFSAIKENGYQLLFLSARSISQAYQTRQFLFNLKQDGKALPDGPVVISPDGLFPSLYREVIRRAPHEFKIACLEDIKALFPSDCNPFYAGFGNRDTDEFSYLKVGIPKGKIFIINPKGEVAVNRRVDTKSYTSLHALVHGMFPPMNISEQEDYNSWNYWKLPPPGIDF